MNKLTCASIVSVHRSKSCSRKDVHCSVPSSCPSPSPCALVRTFTHAIGSRWLLLYVVALYKLKEVQIQISLDGNFGVFLLVQ